MGRLANIELHDLHELLDEVEGKEPTQPVLAAIGWKQGMTLAELAEQHDVAEKTIRNWLDRFSERPIAEAPYDAARSGRPGKLSRSQRETVFEHLRGPPAACGYDRAG